MKTFAKRMVECQIVSINPKEIRLDSGIKSPVYCDIKKLQSNTEIRHLIVSSLVEMIESYSQCPDGIAGVMDGMIPFSSIVADRMNLPHYSVGQINKRIYGVRQVAEGEIKKGMNILVLEDVVTAGKGSIEAVKKLRQNGANVEKCLAIVSYGTKSAKQAFKEIGCELDYLTSIERIIYEHLLTQQPAKKAMHNLENFLRKYIPHGKKIMDYIAQLKP